MEKYVLDAYHSLGPGVRYIIGQASHGGRKTSRVELGGGTHDLLWELKMWGYTYQLGKTREGSTIN